MVTYIGNRDRARKLAGHPKTTEVSDTDMDQYMEQGHDLLTLFTKKKDWANGDDSFETCQTVEELFAASLVRSMWRDPDNKSQELFNRAKTMVNAVMENQSFASANKPTGESQTSTSYKYKTPALNEDAAHYKSPRTDF